MKNLQVLITAIAILLSVMCISASALGIFNDEKPIKTEAEPSQPKITDTDTNSVISERENDNIIYLQKKAEICQGTAKIYDYKTDKTITIWNDSYGIDNTLYKMDIRFNSFEYVTALPMHLQSGEIPSLNEDEIYLVADVSLTSHSKKDEIYLMNSIRVLGGVSSGELEYSSDRKFIGSARCHYELLPEEELNCQLVYVIKKHCVDNLTIVVNNFGTGTYDGSVAVLNITETKA